MKLLRGEWIKIKETPTRVTYEYHRPLLPAIIAVFLAFAAIILSLIFID